ncbi:uncharacterized protein AMSG_08636 [Thecamonas trahens ATCC 50062]|uniref:Phospholipid/glycerol acyltransferase domain-containing protein n=1 Tax=Thecamonas trahens ATCC 50062 TaxID=461836 RepID=A0A0L0DK27_THETB|nr:hypothetical protein AMSG_08636 [Thecamonas trahens ATCC 50062]KNC52754.1 hypothetical protein AMSG_08636 [Thecamonas trahens ATCC 50062]|eukprot:XP_013755067.1 hypothetical protein AMSG_08636 [Thecamonas trahens ATCC 50062]
MDPAAGWTGGYGAAGSEAGAPAAAAGAKAAAAEAVSARTRQDQAESEVEAATIGTRCAGKWDGAAGSVLGPFVRRDAASRSRWRKAVAVALLPVAVVRLVLFVGLAVVYWGAHAWLPRRGACGRIRRMVLYALLRAVAAVIGFVAVSIVGARPPPSAMPPVIVANHMSYLDVLFLLMLFQPAFVSAACARHVPIIGPIATSLRCLFVDFDAGAPATSLSAAIAARVGSYRSPGADADVGERDDETAVPLAIFPEGTTTNGTALLRFRTGAFVPLAPVLPVIIEYPHATFSPAWESIEMWWHILFLLTAVYHSVTSPREYADAVAEIIATRARLPIVDARRSDKLLWHAVLRGRLTLAEALARSSVA